MLPFPELNPAEARVLGALLEKELATPDTYPLTLSALTAACNQKSNRDPVMALDDALVEKTLHSLRAQSKLASLLREAGARVPKFRHEFDARFSVTPLEKAVLAELLLRGPQTLGELKNHCARLIGSSDTDRIAEALDHLDNLAGAHLVERLPLSPGAREPRYAHLLSGPPPPASSPTPLVIELPPPPDSQKLADLENQLDSLRQELASLRQEFESFRSSF